MTESHKCPYCGKAMSEQPKFPGLWTCPDYVNPLNESPPFEYKCTGIELTKEGEDNFDAALWDVVRSRN